MSMLLFPSSIIPLNITSFHFLIVVFYIDVKRNKRVHLLLYWTNRSFLSLVIYSIELVSLNKERRTPTEHLHHNIWHRKLDHRYTTNSAATHVVASQSTMFYERIVHTVFVAMINTVSNKHSTGFGRPSIVFVAENVSSEYNCSYSGVYSLPISLSWFVISTLLSNCCISHSRLAAMLSLVSLSFSQSSSN